MIHGGNVWQGDSPSQWLDYSANIRPEGAPEWVKRALGETMDNISYYPDPEMKRAKQALSEYLGLPSEYVLPTAGGISAIDIASHLGERQMFQFVPCFAEYSMLSENRGKNVNDISLLKGGNDIGDPAEQAKDRLVAGCTVWLCNPLNPIGCAFSIEQIERLLHMVEENDGWLVVDEAFIEYCREYSVVGLIKEHERLLVTGSMTKILGIPGIRLGYICAQPHVLKNIGRFQLTWELNCFAEAVLCELPKHKADIQADAEMNESRREKLRRGLESLGLYVYPSKAPFLTVDFGMNVDNVTEALKAKGILVRKCMNFSGIDDGCHMRLAVKDEESNGKLLRAIREALICVESL